VLRVERSEPWIRKMRYVTPIETAEKMISEPA
jgi:hypothetical protein